MSAEVAKHSNIIGGSTAWRRSQCTGSAALEAQYPEKEKTAWAREGDALHWLMYTTLDAENITPPVRGIPFTWVDPDDGVEVEISAETLDEKFFPALEAVLELIETHNIETYDLELRCEHTSTCDERVFGTLDFVGRSADGYAVIIDFKFGSGVKAHARENYQLAFYTVGLWEEKDPLIQGVEKFVFAIVQPWRGDEDAIIDEWETDMWWVENYRQQEAKTFLRIINNDVSLKAGEWCQFCRARPECPEQNNSLIAFSNDVPAKPSKTMTVTELARLLDIGEQAVKQYAVLYEHAQDLAETQGVQIPGWKCIESLGNRRYKDPEAAMRTAVNVIGSEAFKKAPLSPKQMEAKFKKLKEDFSCMQEHIERPSRGGKLVRDSNPAPEIATARDIELPMNVIPLQKPEERKKNK
jgi:hypothetical protein